MSKFDNEFPGASLSKMESYPPSGGMMTFKRHTSKIEKMHDTAPKMQAIKS